MALMEKKRCVCIVVAIVKCLLILLSFTDVVRSQDHGHDHDHDHGHDHGHSHGHGSDATESQGPSPFILTKTFLLEKELNAIQKGGSESVVIEADRVTEIVELLLGRFNCSNRLEESSCHECAEVITDRIAVLLGTDRQNGIDEEGFNKASVVLLHLLSAGNLQHACTNTSGLESIHQYATSILGACGTASVMTKDELKSLLYSMTSYYQPSSYAECFDEDTIFSVLHGKEMVSTDDDVINIATNIIVKLLEGQCIGHAQEVGPTTFLDAVLQTVSADDYLSEAELDELMFQLSIGGDHSMHDHSTHDHAHEEGDDHAHDDHDHDDHAHDDHDHDDHDHAHDDHDHDHDDHHDHLHRREVVRSLNHRRTRRDNSDDGHDHAHEDHAHEDHDHDGHDHDDHDAEPNMDDSITQDVASLLDTQCYTSHQLFNIHGINESIGIYKTEFPEICPSLIQQIMSGACQHTDHDNDHGRVEATVEVWVYGMLSVVIISCCSLIGAVLLPCMGKDIYVIIVNTLVALAVAVMTGDALIHLLPMALGLHVHDPHAGHDHHHDHSPFSSEFAYVWKCTIAMGAVYAFFLFETIVGFITDQGHSHGLDELSIRVVDTHSREPQELQDVTHAYESGFSADQITAEETAAQCVAGEKRNGLEKEETTTITSESQGSWTCCQHGSLPIMVIIGDGLHNFGDGLAIGAAFLAGMGPGLSTSLAVFCHELPHELGDLAVLLKSGISLKWALFLNFLSALTCVAGLMAGITIGVTLEARQWIFALTAGAFLYVALADMLPQVIRVRETKSPKLMFILINIGFICGLGIILIIALYEDSITVSL